MQVAQRLIGFQMRDRGRSASRDDRRQRGRKDETRCIGAHSVTHFGRCRDVSAVDAKGLTQGAVHDVDAVQETVTFSHTTTARAIHANGVHFIKVG